MHRVKSNIEEEKDKKQLAFRRSDDKPVRPQLHRRRPSQQRGPSGAAPVSPSSISPRTTTNPPVPLLPANGPTESPTQSFTPIGVNGATRSFTPQSQTGSSPSSERVYPFTTVGSMQQGLYTPFGNSPPLFPVPGGSASQQSQGQLGLANDMMELSNRASEDDTSGHFWQSLFGPPGSSLPRHQYPQSLSSAVFVLPQNNERTSPGRTTTEFRDPNDINMDGTGEVTADAMLDEMDNGLVDWGDFIAQCSQVWVTE
jgi:hypothetical protein